MASIRKNVITATFSSVFNNLSYFVFVLFLAKKYSVLELSYYSLSFNVYFLATLFASLGIGNLIIREYHKSQQKLDFVATLLSLEIVAGFIFYGVTIAVMWFADYGTTVIQFLFVVCLIMLIDNVNYVFSNVFVSVREQHFTAIASSVEALLKMILGVAVFYAGNLSLLFVSGALVGLRLINCIIQLRFFLHHQRLEKLGALFAFSFQNRGMVRSILVEGKTFFLITLIVAAYGRLPVIMLPKLSSLEQVTYMDMGLKAFAMVGFVPTILVNTFYPTILKHIGDFVPLSEKTSKFLQAYLSLSNIAIVLSYLFLVPIGFRMVFGHKFDPSIGVFQIVVLSLANTGITSTRANIFFAHGMERMDLYLNAAMLIAVVALTFVLVPFLEALGAALAVFISRIGFFVVQGYVLRSRFPKLRLQYSFTDAIVVPIVLAFFVLYKDIPYQLQLVYGVASAYLIALVLRYQRVLIELLQGFILRRSGQAT